MAELNIITWMWGQKYHPRDVIRLAKACKKHLSIPHRFHVVLEFDVYPFPAGIITHRIQDRHLIDRHCFCRLRMFDPEWQSDEGLQGTIVSLDLDLIILGNVDQYFGDDKSFMILQDVNSTNPCRFNASIMKLRAGEHAEVWKDFSLTAANAVPHHEFADDQGWIFHKLRNADGWKAGKESGIYGFQKPGWPGGNDLPKGARIVAFIGTRKPQMYSGLKWIKQHWIDMA